MKSPNLRAWSARLQQLCLLFILVTLPVSRLAAQESPVLVTNPPAHGTFYLMSTIPSVPYPFDPYRGALPVYAYDGVFFVDNSSMQFFVELEGGGMMLMSSPSPPGIVGTNSVTNFCCNSLTNFTVGYFSNANTQPVLGIAQTTNPWIALTIQASNTSASYDVFGTTNMAELALPSLSRTHWARLTRAHGTTTNFSWGETNWCERYFQLGTTNDSDGDGLTDAYENRVTHSSPSNATSPRAIYETVIASQNPSNWFKLNDGSLTNAIGGAPLTNNNAIWDVDVFATGNNAIEFNGNSQRMTAGDVISGGTGTNQGSMSLLFRSLTGHANTNVSIPRYVLCQKGNSTDEFALFFETTNTTASPGSLKIRIGAQTNVLMASSDIVFGTWYFLAMTWNESTNRATWYLAPIGGTLSCGDINLVATSFVGNSSNVVFGNRQNDTNTSFASAFRTPGNGALDQIAFWSRELTDTEVNFQFNTLKAVLQGPSKVFDLSRWELTLPVNSDGQLSGSDPLVINTGWLNSGFRYVDPTNWTQKYFYLSGDNKMVFEAPWNGADQDTSSNSPRSELRGTLADGSEDNWKPYDPATGTPTNTHTLQASCKVTSGTNKVVIGQIHAETPSATNDSSAVPAVILSYNPSNGVITVTAKYNPYDKNADTAYNFPTTVPLGETINYTLQMVGSGTNVTLNVTANSEFQSFPMTQSPFDPRWGNTNVTLYFKAGCYFPKAPTNSGTAKVTFSSLTVTP